MQCIFAIFTKERECRFFVAAAAAVVVKAALSV